MKLFYVLSTIFILVLVSNQDCLAQNTKKDKDGRDYIELMKGESCSDVSRTFNVSLDLLKKWNPQIPNLSKVNAGQRIYLSPPVDQPQDGKLIIDDPIKETGLTDYNEKVSGVQEVRYNGKRYVICKFGYREYDIDILHKISPEDARKLEINKKIHDFRTIRELKKDKLVFAMNAGMFERTMKPVGWLITNGEEQSRINTDTRGYGNFYSLPFNNGAINGIFGIKDNGAPILHDTRLLSRNARQNAKVLRAATQSGPLLIMDGKMNPKFNQGSPNLNRRNAVGINDKTKEIVFIVSDDFVNFFDLSSLFFELGCSNALYLDGVVSTYYAPKVKGNKLPRLERPLSTFIVVSEK